MFPIYTVLITEVKEITSAQMQILEM